MSGRLAWLGQARGRGFFSHLPDHLVEALVDGSHPLEYPAGAVWFGWDERAVPTLVLSGSLRLFVTNADGCQLTLRYLGVGDLLGWTNLKTPRAVQVLDEARVLILDPNRQRMLTEKEPAIAAALREETRRGIDELLRMSCVRAFGSIRTRVASAIMEQAKAAGSFHEGGAVAGTHEELATAIGSVREVVGSALQAMKKEGLVKTHRGGVVILKPQRLEAVAAGGLGPAEPYRSDWAPKVKSRVSINTAS